MECCICFYTQDMCQLLPCNHSSFCKACLEKSLAVKLQCPICRTIPIKLVSDAIKEENNVEYITVEARKSSFGISVRQYKGDAVLIYKLSKHAYKLGLRLNDQIRYINSIPCTSVNNFLKIMAQITCNKMNTVSIGFCRKQVHWIQRYVVSSYHIISPF